jgi:rRNA maturation endonuclease Nob1
MKKQEINWKVCKECKNEYSGSNPEYCFDCGLEFKKKKHNVDLSGLLYSMGVKSGVDK